MKGPPFTEYIRRTEHQLPFGPLQCVSAVKRPLRLAHVPLGTNTDVVAPGRGTKLVELVADDPADEVQLVSSCTSKSRCMNADIAWRVTGSPGR